MSDSEGASHRPSARIHLDALDPERWQRLEALFQSAWDLPAEARSAYLDEACPDASLRAHVQRLLDAAESAPRFLEPLDEVTAPPDFAGTGVEEAGDADAPRDSLIGRRIGAWRLLRRIGRGGMGAVYQVERADGQFEQRAALKLIRHELDSVELRNRFLRERQILARLDHPNIARLLDGGVADEGQPFLVMEYVAGVTITEFVRGRGLSWESVLRLVEPMGRAVEYAHQNLVVHRDLKPSNVLVTEDGTVKLLDFGIAKLLDAEGETIDPERRLTPDYAAPEQIRGEPPTTATDVYSLGVILYELLAGHRPARGGRLHGPHSRPAGQVVRDSASDASPRATRIPADLDAIVTMALMEEPEHRYRSVVAMMDDLARLRDGQPVRAAPSTLRYRFGKWIARHRLTVTAAAVVAASLLAGSIVSMWQARVALRERDRARAEAAKADELKQFALGLFEVTDPYASGGAPITLRQVLDRGAARVDSLRDHPEIEAEMLEFLAKVYRDLGDLDRASDLARRSVEIREAVLGPRHGDVASSLQMYGAVLLYQGEYARAESTLRRSLAIREERFGKESHEYALTLGDLAVVASRMGRSAEAESLYREVLAADERRFGPVHDDVAVDLSNLGVMLQELGRSQEALPLVVRAHDIRRRLFGADDARTLLTLHNLGGTLEHVERYAEAESVYRVVIAGRRTRLGPDHPDVGLSLQGLGSALQNQGRYAGAESAYVEALAVRERAWGKNHPDVALTANNLAVLYYWEGRYDEAKPMFETTLRIWRATLGPDHPSTLTCWNNLGVVHREQGHYEESERILRTVMERRRRVLGPENPAVANSLHLLGQTMRMEGNASESERLLREALAMRITCEGRDHTHVAETETSLATTLRDSRPKESVTLYRDALRIFRATFDKPSLSTADALEGLGRVLLAMNRVAEADAALREALDVRAAQLRESDRRLAEARAAMGLCRAQQGDSARAERLLAASVPVLERAPRSSDPILDDSRRALARLRGDSTRE